MDAQKTLDDTPPVQLVHSTTSVAPSTGSLISREGVQVRPNTRDAVLQAVGWAMLIAAATVWHVFFNGSVSFWLGFLSRWPEAAAWTLLACMVLLHGLAWRRIVDCALCIRTACAGGQINLDDDSIAISYRNSVVRTGWDQIVGMDTLDILGRLVLRTQGGERTYIILTGYPRRQRLRIEREISLRAGLNSDQTAGAILWRGLLLYWRYSWPVVRVRPGWQVTKSLVPSVKRNRLNGTDGVERSERSPNSLPRDGQGSTRELLSSAQTAVHRSNAGYLWQLRVRLRDRI